MLSRIPLWLVLNYYTFLLDAFCIAMGLLSWGCFTRESFIFALLCAGCVALIGYAAIVLHSTYPMKRHLFATLKRRNRKQIHLNSFKDFVDAPCHRLIVRTVLAHVSQAEVYREVLKLYYVYPWKRRVFVDGEIVVFRTPEAYEAWRNG